MRGEYHPSIFLQTFLPGSSPRAWGILKRAVDQHLDDRFIPTCVGNTFSYYRVLVLRLVHPHVRGEYAKSRVLFIKRNGSSPRAWGIHNQLPCQKRKIWFIPTCVGNTLYTCKKRVCNLVHPHVRGEYLIISCSSSSNTGSSPRAWGILSSMRLSAFSEWFIPTCVWNTLQQNNHHCT